MQADDLACPQELIQLESFDAVLGPRRRVVPEHRIEGLDVHPQRSRPDSECACDQAKADKAEDTPSKLTPWC
jgi:hypothetical protein